MAAKIYSSAKKQILEIWDYTERMWGETQADKYIRDLITAINTIAGERHRWRPVMDNALSEVFFFRHRHHYVFFRELPKNGLGVISILHENMDIPSRLRQNSEPSADE